MKNLLIVTIIVAALGGAMYLYLEHEPVAVDTLTSTTMGGVNTGVGGDQLSILRTLQNLVIDTSLFERKVWGTFQDSGHVIEPQPKNRQNPFAPINLSEVAAATAVTSTSTATTTAQ